jgi:glycosyltransferase involved in cell wall biosynthesis
MPELFSTMFDERRRRWLIWLIKLSERLSIRFADRVLTVTQEMKANFCRRGADPRKITVIVNVPDDRYFRLEHYSEFVAKVSKTRDAELKPGTVRILSHGSIEDRYGYDLIVHAVAALKTELPNLQFRFMGQGGSLHDVLKLACNLGIADQVRYLGFVPFETMVEEIIAADITVVPMKKNPYSILVHTNKMFEYLALQRPIVASRLDSVASYFPDSAIAYFKPDDSSALAQTILQCVGDPEASRARVRAATEVYERYRWSNERSKYLDVYRELLKDQPRGTTVMGAA